MTAFQQAQAGWVRPPLEGIAGELATAVIETVKDAARNAPRSLQVAPGPSEIGTPCTRRLAYRVLDWEPKPNSDTDPWPATVGTSIHAWMAETYAAINDQDRATAGAGEWQHDRYLIEHEITLPGGITGHCDLYDRGTAAVIDWKTTGNDKLRKYRLHGPGPQYRAQAHMYALGMQLAGEHPEHVVILFLPRSGRIDTLHAWSEPYNPQVAVEALKRYQAVRQFHYTLDPEKHPQRWALQPTADAYCTYCPWFLPGSTDLGKGCPGHHPAPKEK
jgi:hypothetical protein